MSEGWCSGASLRPAAPSGGPQCLRPACTAGNELYNIIDHNVVICPWAKGGPKGGCTVPGTDNGEADTTLNQAGLWALPSRNHILGNRFANSFNGW